MNKPANLSNSKPNRSSTWLIGIFVSSLLGLLFGWLGSYGSDQYRGMPVFAIIVGWAFVLNWLVFIPSFLYRTEKYFDLTGALTYISATLAAVALAEELDTRSWISAALVIVWAGRLGSFLFLRIQRDGHDVRFNEMKHDFWQFLMTWTIQGLWVTVTASAAFVVITATQNKALGFIGILGLSLWLIGFLFEVVADRQKSVFKTNPDNKDKFISTGLWSWSRHPNYFGEITLWTGMLILALPVLSGSRWFAVISPIFVYLLLTRISGIPMLQKRGQERWGDLPEYQRYLERTSLLIPLPPSAADD